MDITDYLRRKTGALPPWFKGVLAGDTPPASWPAGGYLVNIDRAAGPGTHWTALWITARRQPLYYDPTGSPPPKALYKSLRALPGTRDTLYSTTVSQREGFNCGARAALALEGLAASAKPTVYFRDVLAA